MVRNFAPYTLRDKMLLRVDLKENPPSESAGYIFLETGWN
jgi:hypothetical protein